MLLTMQVSTCSTQFVTGPLEASKVVHKTQAWTNVKSAVCATRVEEDGSETPEAIVLSLVKPIESGRSKIELKSEHPEKILSMFHRYRETVQVSSRSGHQVLAIG